MEQRTKTGVGLTACEGMEVGMIGANYIKDAFQPAPQFIPFGFGEYYDSLPAGTDPDKALSDYKALKTHQ